MAGQEIAQPLKVLLFAHDPGGANTLVPLAKPLESLGCQVSLYGKSVALEKYCQAGLDASELSAETPEDVAAFLSQERSDCLITGTSANDATEKYLWWAAETLGLPSLAILDQWMNYGIRFSAYGVRDAEKYRQDKIHPYLPTAIAVMDDFAKREMAADGIPEEKILVTGQPYFQSLKEAYGKISETKARQPFGVLPDEPLLLFVSEPLEVSYGGSDYLGYSEKTVFSEIIQVLKSIDKRLGRRVSLIIKLHPREQADSYREVLDTLSFDRIRVLVDRDSHPWELLKASDYVVGMSSMLLLEAALVGKPLLSVQIGLKREDPLVLCRQGKLSAVVEQTGLQTAFESALLGDTVDGGASFSTPELGVVDNPVERVLQWVTANCPQGNVCARP